MGIASMLDLRPMKCAKARASEMHYKAVNCTGNGFSLNKRFNAVLVHLQGLPTKGPLRGNLQRYITVTR